MEDKETLKPRALIGKLMNMIEAEIDDFFSDSVMITSKEWMIELASSWSLWGQSNSSLLCPTISLPHNFTRIFSPYFPLASKYCWKVVCIHRRHSKCKSSSNITSYIFINSNCEVDDSKLTSDPSSFKFTSSIHVFERKSERCNLYSNICGLLFCRL